VVGLAAVSLALLIERHIAPPFAVLIILACAPLIGLIHGLLVTRLRLQPFLVTLCGLFVYRGLSQWATWRENSPSRNVGIGNIDFDISWLEALFLKSFFGVPWVLILFLILAGLVGIFLHATVYGRYLYAIGSNEQAARYAGIPTARYKILAYMWCSLMAGLGGILEMVETYTAAPANAGSWYELYAITGAVLGGCSLRGGEGTIVGIVLGASILPLLRNVSFFAGVPDDLKFTVLGLALLLGTIVDEALKRRAAAARV
jgi:ribose transport system permease protein